MTDDDPEIEYVRGVSYPKVAALVVVCVAVAAAVGFVLGERAAEQEAGGTAIDEGFVVDMRTHHQQAIQMALTEVANGGNPVVVGFAREILVRQNIELGLLSAELDDWGVAPDARPDEAMAWMGAPTPWRQMPGLASDEEMQALRQATGEDADARFLELMAEHHRGGVHMAAYAAEHATAEDVASLARTMVATQGVEINEYRATAARLGLDADIDPFVAGEDPFAHDH